MPWFTQLTDKGQMVHNAMVNGIFRSPLKFVVVTNLDEINSTQSILSNTTNSLAVWLLFRGRRLLASLWAMVASRSFVPRRS